MTPVNRGPECMMCALLGEPCNVCNGTWAATVAAHEAEEAARPPEPTAQELTQRRIERLDTKHRLTVQEIVNALRTAIDEAADHDADDLVEELEAIIAAAERHALRDRDAVEYRIRSLETELDSCVRWLLLGDYYQRDVAKRAEKLLKGKP